MRGSHALAVRIAEAAAALLLFARVRQAVGEWLRLDATAVVVHALAATTVVWIWLTAALATRLRASGCFPPARPIGPGRLPETWTGHRDPRSEVLTTVPRGGHAASVITDHLRD